MKPLLTLLTDFGLDDPYVGVMKGVILGIAEDARIVDLTHHVAPQDVTAAALMLRSAISYFPRGTIHVVVVDPGVGSARVPVIVASDAALFVGPDNGVLAPALAAQGGARGAWRIENAELIGAAVSRTFHGRDIFAPAAAHLATGVRPEAFGAVHAKPLQPLALPIPHRHRDQVHGEIIHIDHFGNLFSNIDARDLSTFATDRLFVSMADVHGIPVVNAYADGAPRQPVAILNSWGLLEIAIRDGNAEQQLKAGRGTRVTVSRTED